jgi:hypothetical protein
LVGIDPALPLRFLRFRPHGTRGEALHWHSPDDETLELLVETARAEGLLDVEYSI